MMGESHCAPTSGAWATAALTRCDASAGGGLGWRTSGLGLHMMGEPLCTRPCRRACSMTDS